MRERRQKEQETVKQQTQNQVLHSGFGAFLSKEGALLFIYSSGVELGNAKMNKTYKDQEQIVKMNKTELKWFTQMSCSFKK
eukprot:1848811-Amphidinium_carterae.1